MLTLFGDICDPQPCRCLSHNGFLTRAGYRAVDGAGPPPYLDKVVSVSASLDLDLDDTYVREHNQLFLDEGDPHGL